MKFSDGIESLPYRYPVVSKINLIKKAYPKIHKVIKQEKNDLLKLENEAVLKHERLRFLGSIYAQPIKYYELDSNVKVNEKSTFDFTRTCDYILSSKWLW